MGRITYLGVSKPPGNIFHVTFSNIAIEIINLLSVLNRSNIKSSLAMNKNNFVATAVVCDLTAPIRSKTFNIDNFVSELDVDQFLADPTILSCFVDKDHI